MTSPNPTIDDQRMALYDFIGRTYATTRRADPRIARHISTALGDAASVVNVGAGAGSYEPPQTIAAIEPSDVMIAQRPAGSPPAIRAVAEHIPLPDQCTDASMASLTIHHWSDLVAGVNEMRRIARERVVFFTWDPQVTAQFWLLADYFPEAARADAHAAVPLARLIRLLPAAVTTTGVPVPYDCVDGFAAAYWRRPQAYLDPIVRAGMSFFTRCTSDELSIGLSRLEDDLQTGRWHDKHGDLLGKDELDAGYRLVIADQPSTRH